MNVVIFTGLGLDFSKIVPELKEKLKATDLKHRLMHPTAAEQIRVTVVPVPVYGDADVVILTSDSGERRRPYAVVEQTCKPFFSALGAQKVMFACGHDRS